jgi:hypothetical protein
VKLLILAVILAGIHVGPSASTQQPPKTPEGKRTAEASSAHVTAQAKAGQQKGQPTAPTAPISKAVAISAKDQIDTVSHEHLASDTDKRANDENLGIQRKLAWFTGLLFLAGILQAVALVWQARVLRGTLDAINRQTATLIDTAIRQLRAYVCVDSAALKFPQPGVPEPQIHFRNCGQTPAYECRGWIATWFGEHPLNGVLPPPPGNLIKGAEVLAPGRKTIFVAPTKPPLPAQFLALLGTPKFTLYVYGEVHYRDAFGKNRWTKYRLTYGGTQGVRKAPDKEEWFLQPDIEGNEAD